MTMSGSEHNSTVYLDHTKKTMLDLSKLGKLFINGPIIMLNLIANTFFVFCLMTCKTKQVKQPLMLLLGSIVSFTILYSVAVIVVTAWLGEVECSAWLSLLAETILIFMMRCNGTCYVWLMFYYYIMIVPPQQAFLLWVKKNLKTLISVVMVFERLLFLGDASNRIAEDLKTSNGTMFHLSTVDIGMLSIIEVYMFLSLCIMMVSCFATAHYINQHMKSLIASDGPRMHPRLACQIRVNVTGMLQGGLCFVIAIWNMVALSYTYFSPYFVLHPYINITVVNLYITGTTANLAVGQTLFRERVVHVCQALKKRLCNRTCSKGLRPPGNGLIRTSLAIVENSGVGTATST